MLEEKKSLVNEARDEHLFYPDRFADDFDFDNITSELHTELLTAHPKVKEALAAITAFPIFKAPIHSWPPPSANEVSWPPPSDEVSWPPPSKFPQMMLRAHARYFPHFLEQQALAEHTSLVSTIAGAIAQMPKAQRLCILDRNDGYKSWDRWSASNQVPTAWSSPSEIVDALYDDE